MKTYQPSEKEIIREWHLLDAKDQVLGRLATHAAKYLIGKHKRDYVSHMDLGDWVVVKNVEKVRVTGRKEKGKIYYRHSGYPGGFKKVTFEELRRKHPERIVQLAVKRMLPKNRLRADRMARLKLVVGDENPYEKELKK